MSGQTHEGIENFLTTEQLLGIRQNLRGKRLVIKLTDDEDVDIRVQAFATGALFIIEALKHHKLTVTINQRDINEAAFAFYPPYDPLPEPTKANAAGNTPPLKTIHKG